MAVIIPILAAMYLGSTFNMRTFNKGAADVYNVADLEGKTQTIYRTFTKSQYKLVETSSEARDFLDVNGELSLRIKKGDINVQGAGTYLKEITNRENLVELLIRVQHETATETVPSYIETLKDWTMKSPDVVGTHYVRSITYGGELIAFVRLIANNREDRQRIKAAVTAHLQFSGTLDLNAKGNFEQLNKELEGIYNIDVRAMGTISPSSPPTTIPELMKLVDEYPSMVQKLNNGRGSPLKAELFPLSSLQAGYNEYLANSAMNGLLKDVEGKYDDLRTTNDLFGKWLKDIDQDALTEEQEEKFGQFHGQLRTTMVAFQTAIQKMDTSSTGKLNQFDAALNAYGADTDNIPTRFQRMFWRLRVKVGKETIEWDRPTGLGTTYTRWGTSQCGHGQTPLYAGRAVGAPSATFGNGANVLCVPTKDVKLPEMPRSESAMAHLQALASDEVGGISCALCLHGNASSVLMVPGRTECPADWTHEYSGRLMAETRTYSGQDFICVQEPGTPADSDGQDSPHAAVFGAVWADCDTCSGQLRSVGCTVCSR